MSMCDDHEWVGEGDCPACDTAFSGLVSAVPATTFPANSPERDEAIRNLASNFSKVAGGYPLDISVAAATLFMVAQTETASSPEFNAYLARQLRAVEDVLDPGIPPGPYASVLGADPNCDHRVKRGPFGRYGCTKCSGQFYF